MQGNLTCITHTGNRITNLIPATELEQHIYIRTLFTIVTQIETCNNTYGLDEAHVCKIHKTYDLLYFLATLHVL